MKEAVRILSAVGILLLFVLLVGSFGIDASPPDSAPLDALGEPVRTAPEGLIASGLGLGVLLLGSWLFGRLFKSIALPKISGFLAFGVLVGPDVLAVVTKEQLPYLRLVNDLAVALIALIAGGEIHMRFLRKSAKVISLITALQALLILVFVTGAAYFMMEPFDLARYESNRDLFIVGLIIATVTLLSSPSVIVAVMTETNIRGPVAQLGLSVTVAKDLLVVVLFAVVMSIAGVTLVEPPDPADNRQQQGAAQVESAPAQPALDEAPKSDDASHGAAAKAHGDDHSLTLEIVIHLGGSLLAGVLLGLGLAWYIHTINAHLPIFIVMTCFGIAFFSEALGLQALIVALVAGMLMVNVWGETSEELFETIEGLSLPVYCVFFAVAGAKLELDVLAGLWHAALIIVVLRAVMIWISTWFGTAGSDLAPSERRWLWTAFVSQAGVSVLLAAIVHSTLEGRHVADRLYGLIIAIIAMEEIVGPILFKLGLTRAAADQQAATGGGEEPPGPGGPESKQSPAPEMTPGEPADQPESP